MTNEIVKATPSSALVKRTFTERARSAISAAYNQFFGPGVPLTQQAPEGTLPRTLDFQSYINLSYIPRSNENISFDQLRNMSDAYWLIRTVIETRKDQAVKLDWHLGLIPKLGEAPTASALRSQNDDRVKKITKLLARPDGVHDWQTWLRMLIEDLLVIDAVTILPWRTRGGDIMSLIPVDGALIKPILNPMGMVPMAPEVAYQEIVKGMIIAELSRNDLIYAPRNPRTHKMYGFSPVEQIIILANLGVRRTISQINFYTEGTVPEAVVQLPENWSPDQVTQFQQWFDAALAGNLAARRRMTFVPFVGNNAIQWAKDPKLTDEMDEFLARATCFAFSIPPTAFVKQMNRATAQQANDTALREGLEPLKRWIRDLMNRIIQSPEFLNEPKVEFVWEDETNIDKLKQAEVDDLDLRNGKRSVDELRERDGLDKIGVGPGIYTMNGFIPFDHALRRAEAGTKLVENGGVDPDAAENNGAPGKTATSPGSENDDKTPAADAAKLLKDSKKKVLTVQIKSLPDSVEKKIANLSKFLARFLKKTGKKIAAEIASGYDELTKDDADNLANGVDFNEWTAIVDKTEKAIEDVALAAAKKALVSMGITDSAMFEKANEAAIEFAKQRAAEMVGMKVVDDVLVDNPNARWAITDTTRKELKAIIERAFTEGMTPQKLEAAIEDAFMFDQGRAEMIARTELARAHVQGTMTGARASGLAVKKFSLLGSEHDVDDECDVNAEKGEIDIDALFPSGDDAPPFHPNCVCAIEFTYQGEE